MDKLILSTKKRILVPFVLIGAFLLWMYLCHANYESYWNGTIYRVQTTDFNILHHTMPATISQAIISNRDDVVQNVLDSTYGLFGIVVTDPTGMSILYQTNKVYHREGWQDKVTPEALAQIAKQEPPDVLTDPPPLTPIWEHKSPRDSKPAQRAPFGISDLGGKKVLGYIYYIRPTPPTFFEDMSTWLGTGVWELSGAKRGYFYITLCSIAFSCAMVLLIWLRQRMLESKQLELTHIQRELDIRKKALDHLSAELTAQKTRKAWLEKEAEESYRRAYSLKQALTRLRDSLLIVNAQNPPAATGEIGGAPIKVRPAVHPPSSLLEEIEQLIPGLADNADALKTQASLLHDYCTVLEQRQSEMKRIVEHAYTKTQSVGSLIDMSPSSKN
ncbi:MAG TPA: hypothetical protein V6C81_06330 [Planktothrix sp.]|jgi:hypothetical protein